MRIPAQQNAHFQLGEKAFPLTGGQHAINQCHPIIAKPLTVQAPREGFALPLYHQQRRFLGGHERSTGRHIIAPQHLASLARQILPGRRLQQGLSGCQEQGNANRGRQQRRNTAQRPPPVLFPVLLYLPQACQWHQKKQGAMPPTGGLVHQSQGADDKATYPNNDQQFCHLLILSADDSSTER